MPEATLARVALLATGGTIAGVQDSADSASYRAGSVSAEALLQAVPGLQRVAQVLPEQLANVGSQNMTYDVWRALAARVNELCADPSVHGVVITHGTDTLEETAYFLSLVLPFDKPVVLVGAMRPATALSADGPRNLLNAVTIAAHAQSRGRGPLVTMNDDIHYARMVQKMSCGGVDAFASPGAGRAGWVRGSQVGFYGQAGIASAAARQVFSLPLPPARNWPRVEIAYACVDMDSRLIDFMASYAQGIVLAGVGDGNATADAIMALDRAVSAGVAVVRATRTGSGRVTRNIEVDDDGHGTLAAGELNPQKARILLTLGLMYSQDPAALQQLFNHY
ncbi:asparaginase [Bordetella genomosp. 12]|uniref:L-asparaginase n=1 Tax=Bordetella genomosp. 12 TaxID=463035 RepID=A0A261VU47_9BORD|nr:asparaginase [Bordetella genomosp. 12]OZI77012.1 L-asparaginase [Bordetella genomosp. 12]